jgi:hypothetical protein
VSGGQLCGCALGNDREVREQIQLVIDNRHRLTETEVQAINNTKQGLEHLVAKIVKKVEAETKKLLASSKPKRRRTKKAALPKVAIEADLTPTMMLAGALIQYQEIHHERRMQ